MIRAVVQIPHTGEADCKSSAQNRDDLRILQWCRIMINTEKSQITLFSIYFFQSKKFFPFFFWERSWMDTEGRECIRKDTSGGKQKQSITCSFLAALRNSDSGCWRSKSFPEFQKQMDKLLRKEDKHQVLLHKARKPTRQVTGSQKSVSKKCHYMHVLLWNTSQGTSCWMLLENMAIKYL